MHKDAANNCQVPVSSGKQPDSNTCLGTSSKPTKRMEYLQTVRRRSEQQWRPKGKTGIQLLQSAIDISGSNYQSADIEGILPAPDVIRSPRETRQRQ